MSPTTQAKVLRVLQEREVERIGASAPKSVNIRVVAATNIEILKAVEEKKFRQDLLYRLNVFHIHIPSLVKRKVDIPLLAEHFVKKYSEENEIPVKKIDKKALDFLTTKEWPGNIRELENTIERAVAVSDGDVIKIKDFDTQVSLSAEPKAEEPTGEMPEGKDLDSVVADYERKLLIKALTDNRWKQNKTAEQLGISERSIWYKIKKLGIDMKNVDAS